MSLLLADRPPRDSFTIHSNAAARIVLFTLQKPKSTAEVFLPDGMCILLLEKQLELVTEPKSVLFSRVSSIHVYKIIILL